MFRNFAEEDTPLAGSGWVSMDDSSRLKAVVTQLQASTAFSGITPTRTFATGQVYVALNDPIGSGLRGGLLLDLEEHLKNTIDPAINIWCEPLGDKNSLRNLRGIEIKSPNENSERGL
jgi:hypothetical protein